MRARLIGAALLSAALLVAGCSSGGGSAASSASPSTPATSAAASPTASSVVCQNVAALRASLSELSHLSFGPNALDKLKKDVTAVKDNLVAVKESAGTEWSSQISGLQTALSKLQKTLGSLGSQPSATAAAKAVSTDLAGVTLAGSNLLAAASTRCPAASASPSA
jgi:hypothetical protein